MWEERSTAPGGKQSHPSWGAWIEIFDRELAATKMPSHPSWGAWIEIC